MLAHRGLDVYLNQPSVRCSEWRGIANLCRCVNELVWIGAARVHGLLQRIEHEIRLHAAADAPAHNTSGEYMNHEGDVDEALLGGNISEIRHPELIEALSHTLPIDPIKWTRPLRIGARCALRFATAHAMKAQSLHQPLNRATRRLDAFALHLLPHFVGPVDRVMWIQRIKGAWLH